MGGCLSLWYDKEQNVMMDNDGFPVMDIFRIIPTYIYYLFLKNKSYMLYQTGPDEYVELYWPDEEE